MLQAGGVDGSQADLDPPLDFLFFCSYEHHSIKEPAILLGGAFIVDIIDEDEAEAEKKLK